MKKAFVLFVMLLSSCSVEERIMSWSYTNEWHWKGEDRYQVYKTATGRRYIIVIDEKKLIQKREYLKGSNND